MAIYFKTKPGVYLTFYNKEIISLDVDDDVYQILPELLSCALEFALSQSFTESDGAYIPCSDDILPLEFNYNIQRLKDINILDTTYSQEKTTILFNHRNSSDGPADISWRILPQKITRPGLINTLEAFFTLLQVYILLKFRGFKGLISEIKKRGLHCKPHDEKQFQPLIASLNKACNYFPIRTKCLEWSAALALMSLRRNWMCQLQIGVQNHPFSAHAWVSVKDAVLADNPDLPQTLSVILSEPS